MGYEYVRFQRGKQSAYDALKKAGRLDENTLYFIYDDNSGFGALYMGYRIISGGDITIASASLDDLADVVISETGTNSFLVKDSSNNWISKSLEDVIELITSDLKVDSTLDGDGASIVITDGKISLIDFNTAEVGSQLTKGNNNTLVWVKPNTVALDDLKSEVQNIKNILTPVEGKSVIERIVDTENSITILNSTVGNLQTLTNNVYTKEEVNNEINSKVTAAIEELNHLEYKIVNDINEIDTSDALAHKYIYMVLNDKGSYDEYMVVSGSLEKVGNWDVDLSNYSTTEKLITGLDNGSRLLTSSEIEKLDALVLENGEIGLSGSVNASKVTGLYATIVQVVSGIGQGEFDNEQKNLLAIEPGAQVNTIDDVSEDFAIENKKLILKNDYVQTAIYQAQIGDLSKLKRDEGRENTTLVDEINYINERLIWGNL